MQALLFYANSAKVARGLTERGYPVSGPTVSRWARGQNVTPHALQLVTDLLGQQERAGPDWDRLMRQVDAIALKLGVSDEQAAVDAAVEAQLPPPADGSEADPLADGLTGPGPHRGHE
jgi:hypothetical protein